MQFNFQMPTKVYFGEDCVKKNSKEMSGLGRKALIVTGGRSAKASGALSDICGVLDGLNIEYEIFDKVENNPSLETVKAGGIAAKKANAGFIVGIGGGSPLDASKAVAVLAVNDIEPEQLFSNVFQNKPLPIIAIPTTAGTGSEVTPFSVLTRRKEQEKTSFGTPDTFPVIAFLDPRYTESMPYNVTVDTAVDTLTHCIEGYISKRSTPLTDIFAREGIRLFGQSLACLKSGNISRKDRENLLYMSMLGGMVITHTRTTFIHAAGYYYTIFKDIPHGRANGYFIGEYFRFNYEYAKSKIDDILSLMGMDSIDTLDAEMKSLIGNPPVLRDDEIARYAAASVTKSNTSYNIRPVSAADLEGIFKRMQGGL